jgi:hypothetical protein
MSGNNVKEERLHNLMKKYNLAEAEENLAKNGADGKVKIERYNMLYEKGKIKNDVIKMLHEKSNVIKVQNEMSQCTFKPKLNPDKKKSNNKVLSTNYVPNNNNVNKEEKSDIFSRNAYWNQQKNEK